MKTNLSNLLNIKPGITSVIGSGGKTTLLSVLSKELLMLPGAHSDYARVILTTTTHIMPFDDMPCVLIDDEKLDLEKLSRAFETSRVVCVGGSMSEGSKKLCKPCCDIASLCNYADYVLVEADGSHRLPIKAHASWEPVIPAGSDQTILVVGASGFGKTIQEVCHRPEPFIEKLGDSFSLSDIVTPEMVMQVIEQEKLADTVVLNQSETITSEEADCFSKNSRSIKNIVSTSLADGSWKLI